MEIIDKKVPNFSHLVPKNWLFKLWLKYRLSSFTRIKSLREKMSYHFSEFLGLLYWNIYLGIIKGYYFGKKINLPKTFKGLRELRK